MLTSGSLIKAFKGSYSTQLCLEAYGADTGKYGRGRGTTNKGRGNTDRIDNS